MNRNSILDQMNCETKNEPDHLLNNREREFEVSDRKCCLIITATSIWIEKKDHNNVAFRSVNWRSRTARVLKKRTNLKLSRSNASGFIWVNSVKPLSQILHLPSSGLELGRIPQNASSQRRYAPLSGFISPIKIQKKFLLIL